MHLLAQHRGDHDARRGRTDGAGELALDIGHDLGIGRARVVETAVALAREAMERGFGQRLAEKRASRRRKSPIVARPRQIRSPDAARKMSTNWLAWLRSMMVCEVTSETAT